MYDADDEMNRLHEFMRDEAKFREEQEAKELNDIVWRSVVTQSMVDHLSAQELNMLIEELNDAVMHVAENYDVS